MTTPDPVLDSDLDAYIDGQLDAGRRVLVEAYLSERPEIAARVMADLSLRGALRLALGGTPDASDPAQGRAETRDAGRRLERGLSNGDRIATMRRMAAVGLLLAVGWASNAWLGPFRATAVVASVPAPAYAEEAVRVHRTTQARKGAVSTAHVEGYDREAIRSETAIVLPQLPDAWRVADVEVLSSQFGPSVEMALVSDRQERMSLFAVRPGYFAVDPVGHLSRDGLEAAYWQIGDVAYALVSDAGSAPLDEAARNLARTLY